MNITFLVGNGFDLAAGIETKYEDFYKWYCSEQNSKDDDDIIKNFKEDIKKRQNEIWSDFEIGLGDYTKEFTLNESKSFIKCYEDAHSKMSEFILESEKTYDKNLITDDAINLFGDEILNFYQELNPRERALFKSLVKQDEANNTTVNFISFNYTNILDLYIDALTKYKNSIKDWNYRNNKYTMKVAPNVLHIHGMADFYPILGVSDEKYIINSELLKDSDIKCTLVKKNSIDLIGQTWYDEALNIIEKSNIICVFGMSLGESDSFWWNRLLTWLEKGENRQIIIFWYSSIVQDTISFVNVNRVIENVKHMFVKYGGLTAERMPSVAERIHIVINANKMLTIPHANSNKDM